LGAGIASVFLVTVTSRNALEEVIVVLMAVGVSIYAVNYAIYAAAIAGSVLMAMDLPHPTDLAAEGRRIFFTFVGVGVAVVVMFLASLLQKRKASTAASQAASTAASQAASTAASQAASTAASQAASTAASQAE
jgi:uncharacterized membrane protein YgaE (UPF0421/DUF939 family)